MISNGLRFDYYFIFSILLHFHCVVCNFITFFYVRINWFSFYDLFIIIVVFEMIKQGFKESIKSWYLHSRILMICKSFKLSILIKRF
ncbi:hypothetical protein HanRHA438_Chr01g0010961 [Helianthus annuus]|nr:hypothetical protein HanRHA438_Chr01g0010961 [Helianthus annuus]